MLKQVLLMAVLLSLGIFTGCQEGYAQKDLTKTKQVIWEPAISSDHFEPKVIYTEADQGW
jgi:hypothetical protein